MDERGKLEARRVAVKAMEDRKDSRIYLDAETTVNALAEAGMLRDANDSASQVVIERDDLRLRFENQLRVNADLARERDEARRELKHAREYGEEKRRAAARLLDDNDRLRATQSSPEVLELVNATKALVAYWREVYPTGTCGVRTDERIRVEVAHDALAAVERKAEPKPLERWCVVDGDCHYTHADEQSARKYAKERGGLRVVHLREVNATDAAGRKS